ncbi:hypothetical protein [Xanthomonas nasturtii]|uniref:hypothetical protein n=1 Tax=Xanthomonas nasturtii TaxID=1843581 RepID=UPI002012F72D|nr:hypothetical protein [Xanthomonas nasturtii]
MHAKRLHDSAWPAELGLRWLLLAHLVVGLVAHADHDPAVAPPASERGVDALPNRVQPLVLCCSQAAPAPEVVLAIAHIGRHWLAVTVHTNRYRHEHLLAPFRPPIAG